MSSASLQADALLPPLTLSLLPYVVITGGSSGLGLESAKRLAVVGVTKGRKEQTSEKKNNVFLGPDQIPRVPLEVRHDSCCTEFWAPRTNSSHTREISLVVREGGVHAV